MAASKGHSLVLGDFVPMGVFRDRPSDRGDRRPAQLEINRGAFYAKETRG